MSGIPQGLMPTMLVFSKNLYTGYSASFASLVLMSWKGPSVHWRAGLLVEGFCQPPEMGCQESHEIHQRQMRSPASGVE